MGRSEIPDIGGVLKVLKKQNRNARRILPRLRKIIGETEEAPSIERYTIRVENEQGGSEEYKAWLTKGQWRYVHEVVPHKDQVAWRLVELLSAIETTIYDAILGLLAAFKEQERAAWRPKATWQVGQCWFGTTCENLTKSSCTSSGGTNWQSALCPLIPPTKKQLAQG